MQSRLSNSPEDNINEEEEEEHEEGVVSAAAAAGGPPPVAVALASSLFMSEQHPTDRIAEKEGTHVSAKPVVAAPMVAAGLDVAQAGGGSAAFRRSSALADLAPVHEPKEAPLIRSFDAAEGATYGMTSCPLPKKAQLRESNLTDYGMYMGTHHAPKFGDGNDTDKAYYHLENRLSYEYRPSLDEDDGVGQMGDHRSGSFKGVVMSVIRKSVEIFKGPNNQSPRSSMGPSTSNSPRAYW